MRPDRRLIAAGIATAVLAAASVTVYTIEGETIPASAAATATTLDGLLVFTTRGCVGCHTAPGLPEGGHIGPDLTHVATRAGDRIEGLSADGYLRQSIRDPQAYLVPGFGTEMSQMPDLGLSDQEIDAVVAYLLAGPDA